MAGAQDATAGSGATPPASDRGWCLCLSGGGFRATLFHLGVLERLNELGVLARLSTVTSVSGGSILNGVLAARWNCLKLGPDGSFTNLADEVSAPVRRFCGLDLRTPLILGVRFNPANWGVLFRDWGSVRANFLAERLASLLPQRLGEVPAPGAGIPRFIFCATNVRSGACWHFHAGTGARMGDFYSGYCDASWVRVRDAVAASAAFPQAFSALRLKVPKDTAFSRTDPWGKERELSAKRGDTRFDPKKGPLLLTDGGVYDNLAVEPVWSTYDTLLMSDAGRPFESDSRLSQWFPLRLWRAAEISQEQVGAIRKRWLFQEFDKGRRTGAMWTLTTRVEEYKLPDSRGYGPACRHQLHAVRTDFDAFTEGEIACLENHGYSLADAALRSRAPALCPNLGAPFQWPSEQFREDGHIRAALGDSGRRKYFRDAWRYVVGRGHR